MSTRNPGPWLDTSVLLVPRRGRKHRSPAWIYVGIITLIGMNLVDQLATAHVDGRSLVFGIGAIALAAYALIRCRGQ